MHYYEVALRTPRHWKGSRFTYHSESEHAINAIVQVPFGKSYRVGYVIKKTLKPTFATKPIYAVFNNTLPSNSMKFLDWFGGFYYATDNEQLSLLLPAYLRVPKKYEITSTQPMQPLPPLNDQQSAAYSEITKSKLTSLLRGVTGSGKTRIYLHLIAKAQQNGQSTLLLLPEILLTAQILKEIERYFFCIVFHSQLTDSQRSKLWFQVVSADGPHVIIGARSALFLPFQNLGQIIIDEAHDSGYKQENDVRYNSILTAGGLARVHNAQLILGSATPPVTETYLLTKSGGRLVHLDQKALVSKKKPHHIVIDRNDRTHFTRHPLLSNVLLDQIQSSLTAKKQILLFLNRRGTARLLKCDNDDWHAACPNCDLPLTFHHDDFKLMCHSCGYIEKPPALCPVCESVVKVQTLGVKSIAADIKKFFPAAKIGRYDSDASKAEAFYENYDQIKAGSIDIIIGTQQLTKGLDLPLLETVGIINADLSLNFPDYSSSEKQFQLIAQVSGRVNRGHGESHVILQTSDPNNKIIRYALSESWLEFYEEELRERFIHHFPPSRYYAKIIFREKSEKLALQKAQKSAKLVVDSTVIGPLPSFHVKKAQHYYYQLLLSSKSRGRLIDDIKAMPSEVLIDIDPTTLL